MKKDLSQDDRKMAGDAGSTPVVGTILLALGAWGVALIQHCQLLIVVYK